MDKKDLKIVFMGTPEFARASLFEIVNNGYNVKAVFCQPDRPSGRGMKLSMPPVKEYASKLGIPVYQPEKIKKNEEVLSVLTKINPDVIIVVAYGKILPKSILELPKYGCINVHGSLLPKYRGAAPIQWAVMNGERETGITTMFMDEGMDTGDMIHKYELPIENTDTYGTVHDKLAILGAVSIVKTLDELVNKGVLPREKQPEIYSTAPMITKENSRIDFSKNAKEIICQIRGLSPVPSAWCMINNETILKVLNAEYITETEILEQKPDYTNYDEIGKVIYLNDKKNIITVKCKDGFVNIYDIKPQNSRRMLAGDFIRGGRIKEGDNLS